MSIPTGRAFAKALEGAGVVTDINRVTRIVIDIQASDAVRVYVERVGDDRLLDAFKGQLGMMLAENAPEPEPKGVRYWVAMANELLDDPGVLQGLEQAGLSIVEYGPRRDINMRMVLVEDRDAAPELDGKEVELTLHRAGERVTAERRVIA